MPVNFKKFKTWQEDFLARRPHRTLKLTRRRDYVRSLDLPGYIAFTHYVNKTVWANKRQLLSLAAIYLVLFTILVGIGSQETYTSLSDTLQDAGTSVVGGDFSQLGEAGTLFLTIATVGISETPTESQQIYIGLLGLLVWLTTVWLLRNRMAGHKVTLRDALYNAGSPIVSLFLVLLVLLVQMIPILLAVIAYSAAASSGLLNGGVEAMLFWIGASILALISIFWATSTFFAMVIVTLPGVYPMKALRSAGDLVLGRRLRIVLRWLWMFVAVAVAWVIVLVPALLLDIWLRSIWPAYGVAPVIPLLLAVLGTVSLIWFANYVYLLYRKVVDESASK
jgi:hypothetical protein